MNYGSWMTALSLTFLAVTSHGQGDKAPAERPPNVVLILADDLGYGDLGCYGATDLETPNIDRLAEEGIRFTDYHVGRAVCSASRAALLTGCYPERVSLLGALTPSDRVGLSSEEETLAELLKERGLATAAFGKWHLGHHRPFLPLQHGFDEYFGLPYSNDMWPFDGSGEPSPGNGYPPLHLIEGNEATREIDSLADQGELTGMLTDRSVEFIEERRAEPFFLYLAHPMPHVPLGRPRHESRASERGPYGDVIAEIDASVGRILDALEDHGLAENTVVIFTSDNGPVSYTHLTLPTIYSV